MLWRYHGYPPENAPSYPDGMPAKMLIYHWFSRVKKWGPRTVDNLTLEELEWFPIIEEASEDLTQIVSRENQAQRK
jgi:hypothetical protein